MTSALRVPAIALAAFGCCHTTLATAQNSDGLSSGSFGPPIVGSFGPNGLQTARERAYVRLRKALASLRKEALTRQAANGGQLSEADRALIQVRLDAAQARYRRYQNSSI